MNDELVYTKEVQFKSQEDRDNYIKEYSQNCWWLAAYLDSSIPHVI